MPSQIIVICAAALLALGGIWVFISGFDDDDNDGDGMTYPEFQGTFLFIRKIYSTVSPTPI
tara:strand:+ start:788 stop:970 length:183 start_codon:yes stop_codon:yes gene_type:complete